MVQSNISPVSEQEHLSSTLSSEQSSPFTYCSLPPIPEREFDPSVNPNRANLIQFLDNKWVNGTILHYYFFDQTNIAIAPGKHR